MTKTVLIIRAASGAGKSTFANFIQSLYPKAVICCADDHFYDNSGNYKFDASQLGAAHLNCKRKFEFSLDNGAECVIVANTNVESDHWKFYENYAKSKGYTVFFLILEKRHSNENVHGVPLAKLQEQERKILKSIKLT
jgi:predicted ABC-type ATPase